MSPVRFIKKGIELATRRVLLDLLIPLLPVFLEKPLSELVEFSWAQLLDLVFESFESRHQTTP